MQRLPVLPAAGGFEASCQGFPCWCVTVLGAAGLYWDATYGSILDILGLYRRNRDHVDRRRESLHVDGLLRLLVAPVTLLLKLPVDVLLRLRHFSRNLELLTSHDLDPVLAVSLDGRQSRGQNMRTLAMVVAASVLEFASAYAGLGSMGSISLRTACSSAAACAPSRAGLVAAGMTGGSSSRSQNRRLSAMRMCEGDENAAHRRRGTRRHITAFSSRAFPFRQYSHPLPCGANNELRHVLSLDPFFLPRHSRLLLSCDSDILLSSNVCASTAAVEEECEGPAKEGVVGDVDTTKAKVRR